MAYPAFFKLSGGVLFAGGLLFLISGIIGFWVFDLSSPLFEQNEVFMLLGSTACLLGLLGLQIRQAYRAGWLGWVGLIFLLFNFLALDLLIIVVLNTFRAVLAGQPAPAAENGLSLMAISFQLIGGILFGIAIIYASIFPSGAGYLLISASILNVVVYFLPSSDVVNALANISNMVLGMAFIWLGYALLAQQQVAERKKVERNDPRRCIISIVGGMIVFGTAGAVLGVGILAIPGVKDNLDKVPNWSTLFIWGIPIAICLIGALGGWMMQWGVTPSCDPKETGGGPGKRRGIVSVRAIFLLVFSGAFLPYLTSLFFSPYKHPFENIIIGIAIALWATGIGFQLIYGTHQRAYEMAIQTEAQGVPVSY